MKFRKFELKDDVTQGEYMSFRTRVEAMKPPEWSSIEHLPAELFWYILTYAAVEAGWVQDVVEDDGYGEEVTWSWSTEFLEDIPAGEGTWLEWGEPVLRRWVEYKSLDPK